MPPDGSCPPDAVATETAMAVMAAAEAGGDPAAAPESICSSGECPGLSRVAAAAAAAGRGGESAAGLGSAEGLG